MKEKIAIAGFGLEGKALYEYFNSLGDFEFHIFDENEITVPENAILHLGLNIPQEFLTVYKSPGIPNWKIICENSETKILGSINIFMDQIKGMVIGITGTKGKSTTTSLIHHILSSSGKDAVLLGNIGIPPLDNIKSDNRNKIYVYEMSSYMCEMLNKSPHISVMTNIFPDHLNYHKTFEEYFNAKLNITKFQSDEDFFITIPQLKDVETHAKKIVITNPKHFDTKLIGDHNQINCNIAYEACRIVGLSDEEIIKAIKTFEPLPGRLEKIREKKGIIFYEDYLATIPQAAWAGVQALKDVNTIILGGQDRGIDFEEIAQQLAKSDIQNFIIFPETGEKMVKYITNKNIYRASSMEEAVKFAYECTKGICLLSTGSPSFNMFKDYKDRSEQYKYWIDTLGA